MQPHQLLQSIHVDLPLHPCLPRGEARGWTAALTASGVAGRVVLHIRSGDQLGRTAGDQFCRTSVGKAARRAISLGEPAAITLAEPTPISLAEPRAIT